MDARLQKRVQRCGWDKAAAHHERSWQAQLEPAESALLPPARFSAPMPEKKLRRSCAASSSASRYAMIPMVTGSN